MKKQILLIIAIGLSSILYNSCKKDKQNIVKDIDGNIYHTVTIGQQTWMLENLKVTHYNDGSPIPFGDENTNWASLSQGGYCWYDFNKDNGDTYGTLYNWYAVNARDTNNKPKLAPVGWHVASKEEWQILINELGGNGTAGGKLKESGLAHWESNLGADNSSGFTALPGGCRDDTGTYLGLNTSGYWWTSTAVDQINAEYKNIENYGPTVYNFDYYKNWGMSVRCIKD